ncbi:MAG: hypothetical protein WCS28_11680 [Thiomicrospira sp.]
MAQQQMSPQQQNFLARQNLLTTGISMIKRLQPVTGALGSQMKIPLLRMGIMTGVMLQFTVPVTVATDPAVASPVAPWNIAQVVAYNDFAGTQRTRTNGFQLWAAQSLKQGDALSSVATMASATGGSAPSLNYDTNIINQPTAVGSNEIKFSLYVPMAYDPASDLTGAVLTQTNVGEHYITIQLANALVNADPWIAPYISGDVTTTGVTVEAFQYYIQPQSMGMENLPVIDLSTVYGFEGAYQTTANIASGQATYINLPNNRSILSSLITYENGSAFTANGTDLNQITVVANSNTNFKEMTPRLVRETMRNIINSDIAAGTYYLGSRRQPILTQLYANVQAKMDVISAASSGVVQFTSQFEVQYPSGSPLPGITVTA